MSEQDQGASLRDRAVVNGAASVSAVPASVPSAGDKLYAVPTDKRMGKPEWLIVLKVGRKWLTLRREGAGFEWGRCDRDTLKVDSGGYAARYVLYRTKEEYEHMVERSKAWERLRALVDRVYSPPPHIPLDAVQQAIAILSAQAIEARSDETRSGSAVGESAVRQDAPEGGQA